jgi:hypothetical protein
MYSMAAREAPPHLSRGWRRTLVVLLAGCAGTLVVTYLLLIDRPGTLYPATLILTAVAAACLWLLLDSLGPWIGSPVSAEELAHADSAVRRSYTVLLWAAMGLLVYLNFVGSRPALAPDQPHHGTVILWSAVALVFLLPLALAAWSDAERRPPAASVGPIALTAARFRGASAATYRAGAMAVAVTAGVLFIWSRSAGQEKGWLVNGSVVAALLIVAVLIATQLKNVLGQRGAKGDDRRR